MNPPDIKETARTRFGLARARAMLARTRDAGLATGVDGAEGVGRFLLYGVLGAIVGAIVVAIDWIAIEQILHELLEAPLYVQAIMPGIGLVLTALILRLGWRTTPTTSDRYVQAYHGTAEFEHRRLGPKLAAAVTTVGFGGSAGLEGPAIYAGSDIGQWLGRRRLKVLGGRNRRILLAAGAAAGVAAVFRAPATGVLFALETPFRRDIARHALIPALVAAAASYVTFVLILGSDRLLPIKPADVTLTDEILGAVVLGLLAGIAARGIAQLFHWAKDSAGIAPLPTRIPIAAGVLALSAIIVDVLVDVPLSLGPGAEAATEIVLDPSVSVWTIIALFALRAIATSATLGAGGVGGVFIPLVVQGLLLGRVVEVIFDAPSNGLFPVVGLAAVLGAGYRTPMAAVMFVAETTGRSEFVIPALLATAISQSVMGDVSVSTGQVDARHGRLETRLKLPTSDVTIPYWKYVAPDDSLLEVVDELEDRADVPVIAVYDGEYRGLLVLADIAPSLLEHGMDTQVERAVREIPAVASDAPASDAANTMSEHNTAAVAVVNADGTPVGVVTAVSLAGLDDLLT